MDTKLIVSASPHVRSDETTQSLMANVIVALCPCVVASAIIFGVRALLVTAVSVVACVAFEWLYCKLLKRCLLYTSLDIMPGDFYGLVGLNGSGKSTLLKTIAGVYKPSKGKVTVNLSLIHISHVDNKEQVLDYLKKISTSSQHLLSLINDVLDMSRIESGKVKIEEKAVHLPDLVHDIRSIIQPNISSKRLSLFIDTMDVVDEDIITDPLRLNQVLLNILSNAIKFTPTGGMVSIRIAQKPGTPKGCGNYEFRIKDNGIGINKEFQKHIFEEFTQMCIRDRHCGARLCPFRRIHR